MKFLKGVMIGTAITAGAMIMYSDNFDENRKKLMKKGKKIVRKIRF